MKNLTINKTRLAGAARTALHVAIVAAIVHDLVYTNRNSK